MNYIRIALGLIGFVLGIYGTIASQKEGKIWALASAIWAGNLAIAGI